ncbi:TPA: hypothetical protein JZG62_004190 [Escherichia coli]|nr:hypothetical protein [Escherichia coli]
MNKNESISYTEMQKFFAREIKEVGGRPITSKNLELSLLPIHARENLSAPEMPWYTEVNDIYMEFRRSPFWMVAGYVFLGFMLSLLSISILSIVAFSFYVMGFNSDLLFLYLLAFVLGCFILPGAAKIAFFTPHYLPIRFNRKTQKIYVSDLIIEGNVFFGKIKLTFHEYDWKDVEGWEVSRHFSKSMPYNGLHLVVNRENDINALRQTRVYTTRAPWSAQEMARQKNYIPQIWLYCHNYMAYETVSGAKNKPQPFIFLRNNWLFKWPKEMDKRSRSSKILSE